jgi:UDP:flavonoid glycosyltransferase YjiC (YdhE family)
MNSVMEALHYGVGMVTFPHTPEQVANAERVVELGLGERMEPDTMTAASLRAAIDKVASDPGVRANLAGMCEAIRRSGGAVRGADVIEDHLGQ